MEIIANHFIHRRQHSVDVVSAFERNETTRSLYIEQRKDFVAVVHVGCIVEELRYEDLADSMAEAKKDLKAKINQYNQKLIEFFKQTTGLLECVA